MAGLVASPMQVSCESNASTWSGPSASTRTRSASICRRAECSRCRSELLEGRRRDRALLAQPLKYPEANGSRLLRERIALAYPGADADNVLVTTGTSEANYTTLWGLLEKGDRVAVMIPCYLQTRGLARAYGGRADAYRLVERGEGGARRWALDVESLRRAVGPKTRAILVTNPNNPTGSVLSDGEMDEIVRAARRVGAWIVSDEVYRGAGVERRAGVAELLGTLLPGDRHVRSLEGVRPAGPARRLDRGAREDRRPPLGLPGLHDPHPSMLSDRLARAALEPARRARILEGREESCAGNSPSSSTGWAAGRTFSTSSRRAPGRSP